MPYYLDVFISPIRDSKPAQVLTIGLLILALVDVLMGVANAWFVQHDFKSHEFRKGIIRKLANCGLMVVSLVLDGLLLGGLNLGYQPLYLAVGGALVLMEVVSLLEIFAQIHPELADSEIYRMLRRGKGTKGNGNAK